MSEAIIDIAAHKERAEHSQETASQKLPEPIFMLRVLSGEQAGAQISLRAKRYQLGTDEKCDIVLVGDQIIPHHLDMFFADGCLSITHAHASVYVDGQKAGALPLDLAPMQMFLIGGIALAFGRENGDWPDDSAIYAEKSADDSQTPMLPALQPAGLPAHMIAIVQQKLGLHKIENLVKLALGAACAFSLLIIMITFSLHSTENPISIPHSAADRLNERIQSDPVFEHVKLINTKPKKQLFGYVARSADLNRLHNLARIAHTDLNIVSLEKLNKSLNVLTELYGSHLAYKLKPGKGRDMNLLLYGTIRSSGEKKTILNQLKNHLPAITHIKTDIITQDEAVNHISAWLAQYPNFSGLSAHFDEKGVVIQGNLLGNFRQEWRKAQQKNPPRLPQGVRPVIDVNFSPYFSGRIASITTGKHKQVRLIYKNQTILAIAETKLKSGFAIKDITRNHIILTWRGRDFIYPIPN